MVVEEVQTTTATGLSLAAVPSGWKGLVQRIRDALIVTAGVVAGLAGSSVRTERPYCRSGRAARSRSYTAVAVVVVPAAPVVVVELQGFRSSVGHPDDGD